MKLDSADRPGFVALLVSAALLTLVFAVESPFATFTRDSDIAVYRDAAVALVHGRAIYGSLPTGPFTYPPFAGLLAAPLAYVDFDVGRSILTALSLAALLASVALCVELAGAVRPGRRFWAAVLAFTAVALLLEPVNATLLEGQINLLLLLMVLVDLRRRPTRGLPRGLLIGLAAALKLTPGIFIPYLALTGRLKAAGVALAAFGCSIAVGFLVIPGQAWEFWTRLVFDTRRVGGPEYVGDQSLLGLLVRLAGSDRAGHVAWVAAVIAVLVIGLALAVRLSRGGHELLAAGVCGTTELLICPVSWTHHWVWALPLGIGLVLAAFTERASRRPLWLLAAAAWLILFWLAPVWWVWSPPAGALHRDVVDILAKNSYVWAGLAALGALAAWSWLGQRPRHL